MDKLEVYQGVNYKNKREKVQTLVLHLTDESSTSNHHTNTMFDTDHVNFRVTLQEPMIIDELSDVYLESVLTSNTKGNDPSDDQTAFLLSIKQFKVNSVSNQSGSNKKLLIPNEHPELNEHGPENDVTIHKSKKLNYVCSINPCKLYELSGKLTILDGVKTIFYPHPLPVIYNMPTQRYITNGNTIPATAHDLGYLDVTKTLDIYLDLTTYGPQSTGAGGEDTELFLFRSTGNQDTITDNTLLEWASLEHSSVSSTSGAGSYYDHNDDIVLGSDPESRLTYTAGQLPITHGYFWIAARTWNGNHATLSTSTTVETLGVPSLTGSGGGLPFGNPWTSLPRTLKIKITSDGGSSVDYCEFTTANALNGDSVIYWFRFECTDNSKNFVSQFNIEPRSAMKFHQDLADKTYLNTGYTDKRTKRQTLILDVTIGTDITFSVTLQEPLIIDSLSDVYIDSFTTFKTKKNLTNWTTPSPPQHDFQPSSLFYLLEIDQFNVRTNTNDPILRDKIIIPNESTDDAKTFNHMSRNMNYICSINPATLENITGSIMNLESITIGTHSSARFVAEFVIVSRDDDS
jgi:hypothetical protein